MSWAKICPRTVQSGPKLRSGTPGKGNPYLKGSLGEAAAAAARTDTFLGERYRRLAKRRGKPKAVVATGNSALIDAWHLLSDPTARFTDLGSRHFESRINAERRARSLATQLQALTGQKITIRDGKALIDGTAA